MTIKITGTKAYLFGLSILFLVFLMYNGSFGIIETIANLGLVLFFLGLILMMFSIFTPTPGKMMGVSDFSGYFKFLLTLGIIVVPFIFASKYLGQATLDIGPISSNTAGNAVLETLFSSTVLSAAIVICLGILMMVFVLFLMKD